MFRPIRLARPACTVLVAVVLGASASSAAHAWSTDYPDAPDWWPKPMTGMLRLQSTMAGGEKVDARNCVDEKTQQEAAAFVKGASRMLGLFKRACTVNWERPDGRTFRRTEVCGDATTVHELAQVGRSTWTQTIRTTEKGQTSTFLDQRIERLGSC